ncbi:MAG: DUF4435 domain-containing protein [Blastocatellia bacterium]|nr:DUF4435 domain-containing protein [Blastocatellia bacterium]
MNRELFSGAFLIVEGDKDSRFFRNHIEPNQCRTVPANGKDNAIKALDILERESFKGVLSIVDTDFDFVEGKLPASQNLLFTDHHDLEIMLFNSQALEKVLTQFGSAEKIDKFQEQYKKDIRTVLLEAGRTIGYLRWLSLQQNLGLDFEGLSYGGFLDVSSLEVDALKLIKVVKNHSQKHALDETEILNDLQGLISVTHDDLHICCGHDLSAILSIALRKALGSNKADDVRAEMLEKFFQLSFEASIFSATRLYASIRRWEQDNHPFRILPAP